MCSLRYIDAVSAGFSLVGLIVSLCYIQNTRVAVWESNLIFSTAPDLTAASDNLAMALHDTCSHVATSPLEGGGVAASRPPVRGIYTMFLLEQEWSNSTYFGTPIAVDRGHSYKPWLMLVWILVCSVFFQGSRHFLFCEVDGADCNSDFQYVPGRGPDFWRWVEYALTSPWQIVIIAGLFYLRDIVVLTLLAALQAALVLLGYVIELQIHFLCVETIERDSQILQARFPAKSHIQPASRLIMTKCKLLFLLVCAYIFHGIIWGILIVKFQLQDQAIQDCQNPSSMPPVIVAIISLECFLFSLFGVVLTCQAVHMAFAPLTLDKIHNSWTNVSRCYSILSVTAKLVLVGGFIYMLARDDAGSAPRAQ